MSSVDEARMPYRDVGRGAATGSSKDSRQISHVNTGAARTVPGVPRLTAQRESESEYVSALRLIQRASEAIDMLQDRCRRLEFAVRDTNERLRTEAESSEQVISDWERLATTLKTHLHKSEMSLTEAQAKIKAADERAAEIEARLQSTENLLQITQSRVQEAEMRAQAAEQMAAHEGEIATSFRHTIIETFGSGSRLDAVLGGDPER